MNIDFTKIASHRVEDRFQLVNGLFNSVLESDCKGTELELRIVCRALCTDPDWLVRNCAIEALGVVGNRNDLFRLRLALKDREWVVRCSAVSSLAYIGKSSAWKDITRAADDPDPVVRRYAYVAAVDSGYEGAKDWLEMQLPTEDQDYALVGLYSALFQLGVEEMRPHLEKYASDRNPHLSTSAKEALGQS